jgi:aldehyde dehydrogenase
MSGTINETLIRDVVNEVLGRMQTGGQQLPSGASSQISPGPNGSGRGGKEGVFQNVDDAVAAAKAAQKKLVDASLETRAKAIQCIRDNVIEQAEELGEIEFEETMIGRRHHKTQKLLTIGNYVPGMEMLRTEAVSGDNGLTVTEYAPYGVIGVITPVTHSVPTLACNAIMMIAAGNSIVCNPHPSGARCAAIAVQRWDQLIREATGLENLVCLIEKPTLETADQIFHHKDIDMLTVTGGPGVAKAAMLSGKKSVVAGPGNPPVVVDETADIEKAAEGIIFGGAWDNNLLCVGEKEVLVVESVADQLMSAFSRHGGYQLSADQIRALEQKALHKDKKSGHWVANKEYVGKDAAILAQAIGVQVPAGTEMLFGEVPAGDPWLLAEQMMPFMPVLRCSNVDEAIARAVEYEHGFGHTAMIWSQNVNNMTKMGKAVNTTLFIKNGPSMAGVGLGGEGYCSFSIATPTGEGVTSPLTFTRYRRCVMVENLRIL